MALNYKPLWFSLQKKGLKTTLKFFKREYHSNRSIGKINRYFGRKTARIIGFAGGIAITEKVISDESKTDNV